jgi:hypothetical protein
MDDDNELIVSVARFRALLPEFADSSIYLDEMIQPWLWIAGRQLDAGRWGSMLHVGISWFAAHQLALQRIATLAAQRGGSPGASLGIINSKSVNGVSIGYDTGLAGLKDAGDWNLTTYGIRFLNFARMFGSGGTQVSGLGGGFDVGLDTGVDILQNDTPAVNF